MTNQQKSKKDVYDIVTDHVLSILSSGIIPWRMPWSEGRVPTNLITRSPYRAINVFLLAAESFQCNLFLSEKQLANIGGSVPEGVGPILATHWEWVDKFAKEGEPKPEGKYPLLRYHRVYNVEDCAGIDHESLPGYDRPSKPFEAARDIIKNMPNAPKVEYYKSAASYATVSDIVFMPNSEEFKSKELYYYDLFKLLIYSTAHESRLNRTVEVKPASLFSMESLIADMGAHYLCYHAGMNKVPLLDNLNYIHGWMEEFQEDTRMVVSAATQAQKAVDYILNLKGQQKVEAEKEDEEPEEDEDAWDEDENFAASNQI